MPNEVVDRHEQMRQAVNMLKQRRSDSQLGMDRTQIRWDCEPVVVDRLIELGEREICEALGADPVARVVCSLWVVLDAAGSKGYSLGDLRGIRAGVSRAVREALGSSVTDVDALVRSHHVAVEIAKRCDENVSELRSRKAKDLLPNILEGAGSGLQHTVAVFLDNLSPEQRSDLKDALFAQLSESPVIYTQADREPEDARLWVYWYLYHSQLTRPEVKQGLGGIPKDLLIIRRGAVRHKAGEVVFPLGPMYAYIYRALGREIHKHGRHFEQPGSVNRIAKALKVSHGTATAWLAQDLPGLKIRPDGEGGVFWDFTPATVARGVEIVVGGKRGPNQQA